jgi:hypothetical protein
MMGGWGLKNLPLFYKALMANTLWRILTKPSLWNRVITAKYLFHIPVHLWIRFASGHPSKGSRTWKHLLSSLSILLQWISWNPGNGCLIEVGRDSFPELGRKFLLSPSLLAHLQAKSLIFLNQFCYQNSEGPFGDTWLNGSDLQLDPKFLSEWDGFIKLIKDSGLRLQEKLDSIFWTGGDGSS